MRLCAIFADEACWLLTGRSSTYPDGDCNKALRSRESFGFAMLDGEESQRTAVYSANLAAAEGDSRKRL